MGEDSLVATHLSMGNSPSKSAANATPAAMTGSAAAGSAVSAAVDADEPDDPSGCSGKRHHHHQQQQQQQQQKPRSAQRDLSTFDALLADTSSPPPVSRRAGSSTTPSSVSSSVKTVSSSGSSSSGDPPHRPRKSTFVVNEFIKRLMDARYQPVMSKQFCLSSAEIQTICSVAGAVIHNQPVFLELGTPVKVVGDIHGQFGDLMHIFDMCGLPPRSNYLFLGDYVDRGRQSLETMLLLLCLKIKYPENVFLLRGNHECASVTKVYGFYDECKRRCSVKVWKCIVDVFNVLPIAATVGGKIFCVHGGLSPSLSSINDIKQIQRPTDVPDTGLVSDLLWSDPDPDVQTWGDNDRGVSYCFGRPIVERFCRKFGFDLIARGHMVVEEGYEFFSDRRLVTVFSAPNYCGEFSNWGAVMTVSKDLLCSFDLLKSSASQQQK